MPPYYIEALDSGYRWNSGQPIGTPVNLTFAIPDTSPSYYTAFIAYPTQHRAGVREALDYIETLTNISFSETASGNNSHLVFSYENFSGNVVGAAYYPYSSQTGNLAGDVFIDTRYQGDAALAPGVQQYVVLLHEIGHALGLEHTFEGVPMPTAEDNHHYSLMSYNWVFGPYHQTFSMYDIATLQHLYGANLTHNAGDTVYDLSNFLGTRQTLWDAGGTDTFDGSLLTQNLSISLEEGTFSHLDSVNTLAIALNVTIENAFGGSGNDYIAGNDADNSLSGSGGSDTIVGGAGNDVMDGGGGIDTLIYGSSLASFGFTFTSPVDLIISTVAGVDWGTDTVFGFEWFQFTDVLRDFASLFDEFGDVPNQPPTASNDSGNGFTTDEDTAFATASVLTNDSDSDGGTLSVLSFDTTGTLGLVTNNGDGTFGYDPNGQFEGLAAGQNTTDSFSYTLSDGQGGSDTATVTVTVQGRDEPSPPPSTVLLSDNFNDGDIAGWTVVDEGTISGPSAWSVVGQEVRQSSNIYGPTASHVDHRDGTMLFWNDAAAQAWQDYTVEASFRSTDNDGIGVVFYYTDTDNYYKVDFDQQRGFSTLFQVQGGVETTLATVSDAGYVIGSTTQLAVTVSSSGITVLRDGEDVFGGPVLNGTLTGGTVGLYAWGNTGANFDNVVVTGDEPNPPPSAVLLSDNFDDGNIAGWTVVDEGTVSGPSAWSVVGQEVRQSSNIYGPTASHVDHRDGTTLFWNDAAAQAWQDYTVEASFRSTDNDGIGVVFYYTDADNYYKVDFDQQRGFSTLFQVQGGVETTLATVSDAGYVIGSTTQLAVTVSSSGITVLRDGEDVFGGPVLNGTLTGGTVGLYAWGNTGANFDNVVVTSNLSAAAQTAAAPKQEALDITDLLDTDHGLPAPPEDEGLASYDGVLYAAKVHSPSSVDLLGIVTPELAPALGDDDQFANYAA